jgi:PIN domain nuclease of toxin-antitoxin system
LRLLLDTHALIWFLIDHNRIPARLLTILIDPARIVHVSAAAVWEATIKSGLGKLWLPLDELEAAVHKAGFKILPVTIAHALEVRHLPPLHRDPFDRLLIAQARHEQMTLVTRDAAIRRYQVDTLWE